MINDVGGLLVKDMTDGVKRGVDVTNSPFVPLDPKTVASKKRKGSKTPPKPLLDTHRMSGSKGGYFVKKRATATSLTARVTVAQNRQSVARIHNDGDGLPQRKHFIVPDRAGDLRRVDKRMNLIIRRGAIKMSRAGRK